MSKQIVSKAVGIDLGTTNSAVAIMNQTDTEIIIHKDPVAKRETTPSCVWKDRKTGDVIVGHKAFSRIGTSPSPIRSVKRLMGQQTRVRLTDEEATPEQVSAHILKSMKRQIEQDVALFNSEETEWVVDRAIITVPAYFDQPQIEATRRAGELAGLEVLELLHEPTASACYYCWKNNVQNGLFLVYDLGGGTFDVTVLRCTAGAFEVLGISGNRWLGGDDMDKTLAENLLERLKKDYALDLDVKNNPEDSLRFDKLKFLAEGVKKALSSAGEYLLRDTSMTDKEGVPIVVETMYTRSELEEIIRPIVERSIPYCFDALDKANQKAGVRLADVDAIILAGGPAHIPLVREIVRQNLCSPASDQIADERAKQPRAKCDQPMYDKVDTLVALGAAIRAAASGGLAVYNQEKTVRISFRGTAVTGSKETYVTGKAEAVNPGLSLTGGRIRLIIPELNYQDEADLKDGGVFGFRKIPLQASADNRLTFEVYDSAGNLVATAGRQVKQSKEGARPDGGTTAIISKALQLEVIKDGNPFITELIPALSSLPANQNFTFTHPGNTELIVLPLYQHKRLIKEIRVQVPASLPKGTPVTLNIAVDLLSFITVKGCIGETTFEALAEPPKDRAIPGPEEIAALDKTFREAVAYLPAGRKNVAEARYRKTKQSFENAVKLGDSGQAINDFEELEEMVAELSRASGPIQPPREFFDDLVQKCLELNQYVGQEAGKAGKPYDHLEVAKAIDAQRTQGERAYADSDQKAYSDVIMMLESIHDHIISTGQKIIKTEDPRTPTQKALDAIRYALGEVEKISQFAIAANRKDLQDEIGKIKYELQVAAGDVEKNPGSAQEKASRAVGRLEQIKNLLMGERKKTDNDFPDGTLVIL